MTGPLHAVVDSPVGLLTIVARDGALVMLAFADRPMPATVTGPRLAPEEDSILGEAARQLAEYFDRRRRCFDLPVLAEGPEFARRVWALLPEIEYGRTVSYGDVADRLGDRSLAQRVGQAVGQNPVPIVLPCHRVIGADGSLVGFGGGLARKRALLLLEEPEAEAAGRLL